MDLAYPSEAQEYRQAVRKKVNAALPDSWEGIGALAEAERESFRRDWRVFLLSNGYLAPSWPQEFGGGGLSLLEQSIVSEELTRVGAPQYPFANDANGMILLGPTLLHFGSEDQKSHFLPRTLSGEIAWAQGYSEPEAGSDLFSLKTRATREGASWRISGQKIWQTAGVTANWMFTLVRTNPQERGAKGLSFILVPLDQPGVEVRGIRNMAGEVEFAEVFLDNAIAEDAHVVGGEGNGAKVALGLLGFERGAGGAAAAVAAKIELDRLIELARSRDVLASSPLAHRLADCYATVHAIECLAARSLAANLDGNPPGPESSVTKMLISQYRQTVTELALEILGREALAYLGEPGPAPLGPQPLGTDPLASAAWIADALHARPGTVYGGSLQIQRNTIAERVMGLPRDPRPAPLGDK